MADDPESVVRRVLDAYNAGDVDALLAECHPDVLVVEDPSFPDARTYRGHDGVRELAHNWAQAWANQRSDVEELSVEGDTVRVVVRFTGQGASTGIPVEIERHVNRYVVRDGKLASLHLGVTA
jgi:ketosteroid isomerase-like protein